MLADGTPVLSLLACDMLELYPEAALIVSRDGCILHANRLAHALLADAPNRETAWERLLGSCRLADNDRLPDWSAQFNRIAAEHGSTLAVRDGQGRQLRFQGVPWRDDAGQAQGWCLRIAVDAPSLSTADWDRLRLLAHDLRAPQSSTLALLDLQKDADAAVPPEEFWHRIEAACRKTLRLTDGYLELVRAESQPLQREATDFSRIVTDAIDESWEIAQARRVYLMADLPDAELPIEGDHALLVRALTHLLSNAVRHSPAGSRVECRLEQGVSNCGSVIRCTVTDHGCGLADADRAHLFRCFGRVGQSSEFLDDEGAGLGLAFVRTVARRHGGDADVASVPGSGSTFSLTLPAGCRD